MPTLNPNYNKSSVTPKPNKRNGQATKPVSTPLGQVSASSYQVGNPPENALDGNLGTRWAASGEAVPQWWMLEFSKARQLTGVRGQLEESYLVQSQGRGLR